MLRSSAQGVDPPVCRVLDVAVTCARDSFVDSPAGPFVFSRGSPDILDVTVTYARDSFCGFTGWAFVLSGRGGGGGGGGCADRLASGLHHQPQRTSLGPRSAQVQFHESFL